MQVLASFAVSLVLSVAALAAPHESSLSRSTLTVLPGRIEATLRCQAASVLEVVPADANGDGLVEPHELGAVRDAYGDYLLAHWLVRVGDASGEPLTGRLTELAVVTDDHDALAFAQFVDARLLFEAPPRVDVVHVEMTLFADVAHDHQDRCEARWPDGATERAVLWRGAPTHAFSVRTLPPEPLAALRAGWTRGVSGWQHLALLLSLLVASQRLRTALVGLFLLAAAHAGAIAFAREGLLLPSDAWLSALGPGVLALSGAITVLRRGTRPVALDALVGGLVLGAAEARRPGALAAVPVDDALGWLAWTAGFDVALLAACVAALLVLRPLPRRAMLAGARDTSLVPGYARDAVAMACALLGTYTLSRALIG